MWIRSRDKKRLINADYLHVMKNIGGKNKGILCASVGDVDVSLAVYPTIEQAIDVLDDIQQAIIKNQLTVYEL